MKYMGIGILFSLLLVGCSLDSPDLKEDSGYVEEEVKGVTRVQSEEQDTYLQTLPVEYQRLTIPYLRSLNYGDSQIIIESRVNENALYTSYIGSYISEGLQQYGLLTIPKGEIPEGGWPAVVFIHGYIPPQNYETTERYKAYVDGLAREGLVVFKIDLRGHGDSEGEPNGAYFSGDYVIDTLNAVAGLKQLEQVNAEKVGLWGHSMAGNIVFRSMAVQPDIPVGVVWAGAVYTYADMREYGIQDSSYVPSQNPSRGKRQKMYKSVGEVDGGGAFWEGVNPVNYAKEIEGQLAIHHAINDPVVSVGYGRNVVEVLEDTGMKVQLYEYETGGHNLDSPAFEEAMKLTVALYKSR